jgi:hypothetical protein
METAFHRTFDLIIAPEPMMPDEAICELRTGYGGSRYWRTPCQS